ncbi:hypothetical protein HOB76_08255 [Candidatus Woesearchaeota archaeon]|nr:hypothetical protein [Candidatus Woesearchaeota archaeon]
MSFQVSPGVNTSEIDLTNAVVAAGTSTGGFAGRFRWGPIEEVTLITSEDNLVEQFQKPDDNNFEHFFTAANFLSYSSAVNVVRAANTTVANSAAPKNACANTGTYVNVQVTTSENYYNNYDDEQGGTAYSTAANGPFVSKWAGDLGNTFKYSMCPSDRPSATLTGSVAWAVATGVLTGTGTLFGIELRVGDAISIAGETGLHIVSAVTSNVAVTCSSTSSTDSADVSSGAAATRQKRSAFHTIASNMKGTVVVTADSTTVTGTDTLFDSQFIVGDKITINGETRKVKTLTSNTVIVTDKKFLATASAQTYTRDWEYASAFPEGPPTTSTHAADKSMALDEIHIAVVDEDGDWTGTIDEVVEAHANLSVAKGAKDDRGEDIYYKNWINKYSKFMWWLQRPIVESEVTSGDYTTPAATGSKTLRAWGATADASGTQQVDEFYMPGKPQTVSFSGGTAGSAPSDADVIRAYDLMKSAEDVDVSLLMTGSHSSTVVRHCIGQIAESRKDCITFFSPTKAQVVGTTSSSVATTNVTGHRDTVNQNSSYAVMDSGWKQMFDKHNDKFRYVPLNGDIAGLCAQTDAERDPFFSPGGFTRGQIKGVVKLPYNPKKAERDSLYQSQVNPVVSFPGEGTILFGDKTQLTKPSAFDRINVRRLFILLEKAIANAARFQLFEFNDEFTRSQFVSMVEPFLRDIQGRGGIQDFAVVCDASNNTPQVVDSNSFRGDIFVKPSRAINFIQLNFVAVRSGVEFSEVVGAV